MRAFSRLNLSLLIISVIAACGINSKSHLTDGTLEESIKPLSPRTGEFSECGIRGYKTISNPNVCGYIYKEIASDRCPLDHYVSKADISCPGSTPRKQYKIDTTCDGNPDWEYDHTKTKCIGPRGDRSCEDIKYYRCYNPEKLETCSKEEFGKVFKPCRDSSHPIESVASCEDKNAPLYNSCEIYLTRSELALWIEDRKSTIPTTGMHLITHQANYYGAISDEQNFACTITKFSQDPLFSELITSLKTRYFTIFANEYSPEHFDCSIPSSKPTIESSTCNSPSTTLECRTVRAYRLARKTLEVAAVDVDKLINSPTAKFSGTEQLKNELIEIQKSINHLTTNSQ